MTREPIPLGDSLHGVVRSLRPDSATAPTASSLGSVFGRWVEAVGEPVAKHVRPVKLDGRRLVVEVDDPAWATQLRFLEATLRERVAAVTGVELDVIEARVSRR
jgi:predicted nucleic acid-binding Zn ribbon protein